MTNRPVPAESKVVMVLGAGGMACLGELIMMTGRLTTYTHTACSRHDQYRTRVKTGFTWKVQKIANLMVLLFLSSNCLSLPILMIL
jgi:hypothetical protein